MSESLVSRINRLISGAVNGRVDAMEAAMAETTMRESIREVERTISDVRQQLNEARREQQVAARRIIQTEEKMEQLAAKIQTALDAEREDLAEAAVNRQLDLEAQLPVLEKTRESAGDRAAELNGYVTALNGRKSEMEDELSAYLVTQKELSDVSLSGDIAGETCNHAERVDKARSAFDRVMKSASGVTGMATSDRDTMAKLVELEAVQRKEQVASRLAAFKAKQAQKESA